MTTTIFMCLACVFQGLLIAHGNQTASCMAASKLMKGVHTFSITAEAQPSGAGAGSGADPFGAAFDLAAFAFGAALAKCVLGFGWRVQAKTTYRYHTMHKHMACWVQ